MSHKPFERGLLCFAGRDSRKSHLLLVGIVFLALALALARIWQQPPTINTGETAHTWPIVINLLRGEGYAVCFPQYFPFCNQANQETGQREPLPVFLFAGIALLSHSSLFIASLINVIIYLGTLLCVFWLAQLLANRFTALVAATLWAVYIPAIKLVTSISGDLISSLWTILAVIALVYACRSGRWYYWMSAGLCVGCGALSRTALLVLAPVFLGSIVIYVSVSNKNTVFLSRRALFRGLSLFTLALSITVAPWVLRNISVFGHPILGSTLSGYNLYRENYQLGSTHFLRYVDGAEAKQAVDKLIAHQSNLRGTENEAQFDSLYLHAALNVIEDYPRRYALLSAYRALMLWFDSGVAPSDQVGPGRVAILVGVEQLLLLALAVYGGRESWKQTGLLILTIVVVSVFYMAVNSMVRYLMPVMPLTIVLSAMGVASFYKLLPSDMSLFGTHRFTSRHMF